VAVVAATARRFRILALICAAALAAPVWAAPPARPAAPPHAAIASAHPLATQAGLDMLAQGGNAFDAAVAVSAALAVVEPQSSGVGGGGFYLLHLVKDGHDVFVDGRETAPAAASRDMYLGADGHPIAGASTSGPRSAAIPGEPAAWAWLASHYGRLPLAKSLAPAIRIAREGFPLYERMRVGLQYKQATLAKSPAAARVFLNDGAVPDIGAVIRQPELAATLELIARSPDGFYRGDFAQRLVAEVRAAGGIWVDDDLKNYRVVERAPLVGSYRGARIVSAPPPSSGGVVLLDSLNILSGYDLSAASGVLRRHLLIEAMRHSYRDRAEYLGDPDFVSIPVEVLTSSAYAAGQRESIRPDRATPSAELRPVLDAGGEGNTTTHFSVLDRDGNRVAATISVNLFFGSAWVAPSSGVILNDTMDDFSAAAGVPNAFQLIGAGANSIAPRKRPLSSMTPTFVENDRGLLILGSPGGSTIISMVLEGTLAWLDGANAKAIVSQGRIHHQYLPDVVRYEPGALSAEEVAGLKALGHALNEGRTWGNMQVVTWDYASGQVQAASDPRGIGAGLVY
jgi:gamma-glutamyltranspeptidase / glutathione hydrolase